MKKWQKRARWGRVRAAKFLRMTSQHNAKRRIFWDDAFCTAALNRPRWWPSDQVYHLLPPVVQHVLDWTHICAMFARTTQRWSAWTWLGWFVEPPPILLRKWSPGRLACSGCVLSNASFLDQLIFSFATKEVRITFGCDFQPDPASLEDLEAWAGTSSKSLEICDFGQFFNCRSGTLKRMVVLWVDWTLVFRVSALFMFHFQDITELRQLLRDLSLVVLCLFVQAVCKVWVCPSLSYALSGLPVSWSLE